MEELLETSCQFRELTGKDVVVVIQNRAIMPKNSDIERQCRTYRLKFNTKSIPVYPNIERALRAIRNASMVRIS